MQTRSLEKLASFSADDIEEGVGASFETDERVMFPSRLEAFCSILPPFDIHSLQAFR